MTPSPNPRVSKLPDVIVGKVDEYTQRTARLRFFGLLGFCGINLVVSTVDNHPMWIELVPGLLLYTFLGGVLWLASARWAWGLQLARLAPAILDAPALYLMARQVLGLAINPALAITQFQGIFILILVLSALTMRPWVTALAYLVGMLATWQSLSMVEASRAAILTAIATHTLFLFATLYVIRRTESFLHHLEDGHRKLRASMKRNFELEQQARLRELQNQFISMTSHEFRTPLAAITTTTDVLRRYPERLSTEQREQRLKRIQAEVDRLSALMDDVLLLGKGNALVARYEPADCDLQALCNELIAEFQLQSPERHQLELKLTGPLPSLHADSRLLRHAFSNLLNNAVKFSPDGGTITVTLSTVDGGIQVAISDPGIGIEEADLTRIFNPFIRGQNSGDTEGSGLGLAILQQSVLQHGGRIAVKSELGQGSCFSIWLPSRAEPPAA